MGCGQSKIHLYPRKNKSKSNGKKSGHSKYTESSLAVLPALPGRERVVADCPGGGFIGCTFASTMHSFVFFLLAAFQQ